MYNSKKEHAIVEFTILIRKCSHKIHVFRIEMKDCGFIQSHAPAKFMHAEPIFLENYSSSSSHTIVSIPSWDTALLGTQKWVPISMGRRPATYCTLGPTPCGESPEDVTPAPTPYIDSRNNNYSIGGIIIPHLNPNVPLLKND
jgi:hypothetical protein